MDSSESIVLKRYWSNVECSSFFFENDDGHQRQLECILASALVSANTLFVGARTTISVSLCHYAIPGTSTTIPDTIIPSPRIHTFIQQTLSNYVDAKATT